MNRSIAVALVSSSLVTIAALASACGGQSQAATSHADAGVTAVVGSIGGVSIPTAYALAIPDNSGGGFGQSNVYTTLVVAIASKPLDCSTPGIPNSAYIGIKINKGGVNGVGIGTYAINAEPSSALDNVAALITTDATCRATAPANCIGGSLTIASASKTGFSGSFTLAFDSGEAITGTFGADVCDTAPAAINGSAC